MKKYVNNYISLLPVSPLHSQHSTSGLCLCMTLYKVNQKQYYQERKVNKKIFYLLVQITPACDGDISDVFEFIPRLFLDHFILSPYVFSKIQFRIKSIILSDAEHHPLYSNFLITLGWLLFHRDGLLDRCLTYNVTNLRPWFIRHSILRSSPLNPGKLRDDLVHARMV